MLVNIPARIALFRAYLAEFHSDADATAAFAPRALALIGQDGPDVRLLTSIGSLVAGRCTRPGCTASSRPGSRRRSASPSR